MKKTSKSANRNTFFGEVSASKIWLNYCKFYSTTDDRKQFKTGLSVVLNNKTGPLLSEFNWCKDTRLTFEK